MKKTKYKKISENTFEVIENDDIKIGVIKLEDIEKTRDYYEAKFKEMDKLVKELKKMKGV